MTDLIEKKYLFCLECLGERYEFGRLFDPCRSCRGLGFDMRFYEPNNYGGVTIKEDGLRRLRDTTT